MKNFNVKQSGLDRPKITIDIKSLIGFKPAYTPDNIKITLKYKRP